MISTLSARDLHLAPGVGITTTGQILNGVAALPVSEASVAASIRQQDSSCYGTPISQVTVTCGYPEGTISYACNDSGQTSAFYVNPDWAHGFVRPFGYSCTVHCCGFEAVI